MGKLILFTIVCLVVSFFLGPVVGGATFIGGLLFSGVVAMMK